MAQPETKLARLVSWIRDHMDRDGGFLKSDFYGFSRRQGLERSARDLLYRCRTLGTVKERNAKRVDVLVSRGSNLEQFYKNILKIQDEPVMKGRPKPPRPKPRTPLAQQPKEQPMKLDVVPVKPAPTKEIPAPMPDLVETIAKILEDKFKHIDGRVESISGILGERMEDIEKKVSVVIVQEQEKRIQQLQSQLERFRAKAEAFDRIKRDAWEIIQALDFVEKEREDVKKVLKGFV